MTFSCTYAIENGDDSFRNYALRSARGMGYLIGYRECADNMVIPDVIEPDEANAKKVEELRATLQEIENWDEPEAQKQADLHHEFLVSAIRRLNWLRRRALPQFGGMLAKVQAWQPPTPEHDGFKKFMAEMLEHDLRSIPTEAEADPSPISGKEFKRQRMHHLKEDIVYYTDRHAQEVKFCQEATKWVNQLRASLPTE